MPLRPVPALLALLAPLASALVAAAPSPLWAEEDCDCGDGTEADRVSPLPPLELPGFLSATGSGGPARLDLFVMSLCPYGMEAELGVLPVVARWGDEVDFRLHFIADEVGDTTASPPGDRPLGERGRLAPTAASPVGARRTGCAAAASNSVATGPFSSLHGEPEVAEDRRQLVIAADHAQVLLPYLICRARGGPAGDWRPCARAVGVPPDALEEKAQGPDGQLLLRDNLRSANRLGVDLSPTLLIDGVEYSGRLDPFAVGRALCSRRPTASPCARWPVCGRDDDCALAGPPGDGRASDSVSLCRDGDTPGARCENRPAVAFDLHVLAADPDRCPLCEADRFVSSTQSLFPGARVQRHLSADQTGRDLAQRYGVVQLPAYILSEEFAGTARFDRVRHLLVEGDGAYLVRPRVTPTTYWPARPRSPDRLDLFVPAAGSGNSSAAGRAAALEKEIRRQWSDRGENPPELRMHYLGDPAPQPEPEYQTDPEIQADSRSRPGPDLPADPDTLADSLSLRRNEISVLFENQILARGIQPEELADLWHTLRDR